jgi:hypothetical protein
MIRYVVIATVALTIGVFTGIVIADWANQRQLQTARVELATLNAAIESEVQEFADQQRAEKAGSIANHDDAQDEPSPAAPRRGDLSQWADDEAYSLVRLLWVSNMPSQELKKPGPLLVELGLGESARGEPPEIYRIVEGEALGIGRGHVPRFSYLPSPFARREEIIDHRPTAGTIPSAHSH